MDWIVHNFMISSCSPGSSEKGIVLFFRQKMVYPCYSSASLYIRVSLSLSWRLCQTLKLYDVTAQNQAGSGEGSLFLFLHFLPCSPRMRKYSFQFSIDWSPNGTGHTFTTCKMNQSALLHFYSRSTTTSKFK